VPRAVRGDSRADTAIAIACALVALLLLVLPPTARDRVASVIRGNLIGPLAVLQTRAVQTGRALVVQDSVQRVSDSIVIRAQRLESVTAENAQLRSLLGLGRALEWGFIPAEALIERGGGAAHTLLLSAGAMQGVERLSAVVSAEGLVGLVQAVDARTSVAIIWPHPDFRVSATTIDGSAVGIVTAHEGEGADRWLLELHGVPYRAAISVGTPVVSSGLGGVFPRGVFIGTVVRALRGESAGWSRSYLLRPAVRPSELQSVMVLTPERSAEGVESVWRARVEALERRVRAAGDSLDADSATAAAAKAGAPLAVDSRPGGGR
jgi:rod shape-determining protein MreC